ncbi:hypothetical protein RGQ29_019352 [Quercus rubra]|uniref:Uncharacterized protein n=1 Tax=Quercus rubra TaxID=3512 RepID=A0AAN7FDW7_QUERU|nr:hypothetical protein RGQ29_019352 [Quercus rubra]
MSIMIWNYRRELGPNFEKIVAKLVSKHSPTILIVTKTRVEGNRDKEIMDWLPFDEAIHADTAGYSGRIWLLWNSDTVEVSKLVATEQEIHAQVKVSNSNSYLISTIYACPRYAERRLL